MRGMPAVSAVVHGGFVAAAVAAAEMIDVGDFEAEAIAEVVVDVAAVAAGVVELAIVGNRAAFVHQSNTHSPS